MKRTTSLFAFAVCLGAVIPAVAGDGHFTVGTPSNGGQVKVEVAIPGVIPATTETGKATAVTVNVPAQTNGHNTTAAEKAVLIANAINVAFGGPEGKLPGVATIDPSNPTQINLAAPPNSPKAGQAGIGWVRTDKTHEGAVFASLDNIPDWFTGIADIGVAAVVDYHGILSGVDGPGNVSTFSASFSSSTFTDSASVSFGGSVNSPDAVVSSLFQQLRQGLPNSLQSGLTLDLNEDAIFLGLPQGDTNFTVLSDSSDTGVELTGGFTPVVPEPTTWALLGVGLVAVSMSRRSSRSGR